MTRGRRNCNPGNIRLSKDKWQGLAANQSDKAFFVFKSPEWGIRALARVVIKYQDDYDLDTVAKIITRWAPPSENDTEAYIAAVSKAVGIRANDPLDVHDYTTLRPLVDAIIAHENAGHRYPDAIVDKGLALAGVTPDGDTVVVKKPAPPAVKDGGVLGVAVGGVLSTVIAGKQVAEAVQDFNTAIAPTFGDYAGVVGMAVMTCAIVGVFAYIGVRVWRRRKLEAA
jgi:xanthosine utilization system XapX-like protein